MRLLPPWGRFTPAELPYSKHSCATATGRGYSEYAEGVRRWLANPDMVLAIDEWVTEPAPHKDHVRAVALHCDRSMSSGCRIVEASFYSCAQAQALLETDAAKLLEAGNGKRLPGWDNIDALLSEINEIIDGVSDPDFADANGNLWEPLREFMLRCGCGEQDCAVARSLLLCEAKQGLPPLFGNRSSLH